MDTVTPPTDRLVLAGDMATCSGIALGSIQRGYIDSTVIDMTHHRTRSIGHATRQLDRAIMQWCKSIGVESIDVVAHEEPAMHGRNPNKLMQFAMVTALHIAADRLRAAEYLKFWPTAIKKFCTGSGKADKPEMVLAAAQWSGWSVASHDEADAICLLRMALHELEHPTPPKKRKPRKKAAKKAKGSKPEARLFDEF